MGETSVIVEVRGGAVWATLNRPAALNSLTPAIVDGLHAALDRAENDPNIVAVVIAGNGRAFCAGAKWARRRRASRSCAAATKRRCRNS